MLKHYFIYLIGIILINGAGFLLIPVYATHLLPSEFGMLEIIYSCIDVFIIIFSAGIGMASLCIYSKETDDEKKKAVISTALILNLFIASLGLCVFLLTGNFLNDYFFDSKEHLIFFRMAGFLMLSQILSAVPMAFLQARMDSKVFISVSALQSIVIITLNIIAVVYLNWGVKGILLSMLIGTSIFSLGLNAWTSKVVGWKFVAIYFKRLMAFGLPFIPAGLFFFVLNSADRFFLQKFMDSNSVGIYSLGYKLGTVGSIFVLGPFLRIWGPYMFQVDRLSDGKEKIGKYFLYVQIAYCTVSLSIALLAPDIVRMISSQGYWEAHRVVPYVLFAYLCWCSAAFFDTGFYITGKTYYKPVIMGVAASLIFGLYWLLIPIYGNMGGAYATAIGFCVFSILTYYVSQRIYSVSYPFKRIFIILICAAVLYYVGLSFTTGISWLNIVFKVLMLVLYPVILIMLRIVNKEDVSAVKNQVYSAFLNVKNNVSSVN